VQPGRGWFPRSSPAVFVDVQTTATEETAHNDGDPAFNSKEREEVEDLAFNVEVDYNESEDVACF